MSPPRLIRTLRASRFEVFGFPVRLEIRYPLIPTGAPGVYRYYPGENPDALAHTFLFEFQPGITPPPPPFVLAGKLERIEWDGVLRANGVMGFAVVTGCSIDPDPLALLRSARVDRR